MPQPPLLFTGSSNPELANEVASLLKIPLGKIDIHLFPDKELFVELLEPIKNRDVFVMQSFFNDPNIHLMEMLIMIDAMKRAAAGSITAIIPYYGYARQDRIDKLGEPITAKLIADLLTTAGATKIITLDLHSEQIEGFFNIPVDHLLSRSLLIDYCSNLNLQNAVVVAPDKGGIKIAVAYSRKLAWPMALIEKERIDPFHVEMHFFVGDVKDKTVLLPDDMCSTAGTLVNAAKTCLDLGAKRIIAVVGHGLFVGNALELIENSPIEMLIATNSVQMSKEIKHHHKIKIISAAPLFAEAIRT
jgi:ribose-phosphate pyrophosphokinase